MFLENSKRGLLAHLITFCFAVTITTIGILLVSTNTLTGHESDEPHPAQEEALATLRQLFDGKRQISWGYVGAYRTAPSRVKSRTAFWWDDLDKFLSNAPDTEIAEFASIFTNRTVIAVLRELVDGKKSVADLVKALDISESEVEKAVDTLMKATLVVRTEDNIIRPHNDAVSFFLNFVSMTTVHLGHTKSDR